MSTYVGVHVHIYRVRHIGAYLVMGMIDSILSSPRVSINGSRTAPAQGKCTESPSVHLPGRTRADATISNAMANVHPQAHDSQHCRIVVVNDVV